MKSYLVTLNINCEVLRGICEVEEVLLDIEAFYNYYTRE